VIKVSCLENGVYAVLETDLVDDAWQDLRLLLDASDLADFEETDSKITLPWWAFHSKWEQVNQSLSYFGISPEISKQAQRLLDTSPYSRNKKFNQAKTTSALVDAGFSRKLKPYQLRNVTSLLNLSSGATFSVPGAGKTTEALAVFSVVRTNKSRLLVVCPKNAFAVWEDEVASCFEGKKLIITRLTGPSRQVKRLLGSESNIFLVTYQKLANEVANIAPSLKVEDLIFLDESHHIKKGPGGTRADAVYRMSHIPTYKLLMTGTPMPNTSADLLSQFRFIDTAVSADLDDIAEKIRPLYVRTTKSELGIPMPTVRSVNVPMANAQLDLYEYARSEARRQSEAMTSGDRNRLRALGKSSIRLLQIATNPKLIVNQNLVDFEPLLSALAEATTPKLDWACHRARSLAKEHKKCVIWTYFVQNVEEIAARLIDLNAVFIHGKVEAGDEDVDDTRENKLKRFKNNKDVSVLVANPAACSEAISLHTVCHHAIYVDRTFNAAQYLQSVDRIHRLGLKANQKTTVEILVSPSSIDEVINDRLLRKIANMERILQDDSIHPEIETVDVDEYGFNEVDGAALVDHLHED